MRNTVTRSFNTDSDALAILLTDAKTGDTYHQRGDELYRSRRTAAP